MAHRAILVRFRRGRKGRKGCYARDFAGRENPL